MLERVRVFLRNLINLSGIFSFFTTVAISLIVQHIQDLLALRTPTPTPTQGESSSSSSESQGQTNSAMQAAKRRLAKELSRPH